MSDRKNLSEDNNPYHIYYDNYLDTDASTECTGLMYRAAVNREERDSYLEIYNFTTQPPDARETQQK